MNETNKLEGVKMTQEKNLKKVKVVKHWETGEKHYEDCGQIDIDFYGACNCRKRANEFSGWKISDLSYCYNEATAELNDKRLMTMTRKDGWTQWHCDTQCAESYKNPTRY